MNRAAIVNVGGVCALLGVCAGLAGAVVGAVYGLGGQEIPLRQGADFLSLVEKQSAFYVREWLFLGYAVCVLGEGVGLYYLTRPVGSMALWALALFSAGILIGIVQDAEVVAFVGQFPTDYVEADTTTRSALEPMARTFGAIIGVQQAVANMLLGCGVALYALAVLRTGVVSRWFGVLGLVSAAASVLFGVVTATTQVNDFDRLAEQLFGFVVLWDLLAASVMLRIGKDSPLLADPAAIS